MAEKRLNNYLIFSNIVVASISILYILTLWILNLNWESLGGHGEKITLILSYFAAIISVYIIISNLTTLIYLIAKKEKSIYPRAIILLVISTIVIFIRPIAGLIGAILNLGTSTHDPLQILDFGALLLTSLYYYWKE